MNKFFGKIGSILGLDRANGLVNAMGSPFFLGLYSFDMDCFRIIEDAFKLNADAFTCVDWVAQKVVEAPITLFHEIPGKEKQFQKFQRLRSSSESSDHQKAASMIGTEVEEITKHELLTILNKRPNKTMTGSLFLKGLAINLLTMGNGFAIGIAPPTAPRKYKELYLQDPRKMHPVAANQLGEVRGWRFELILDKTIPVEDVLHVRYFNPDFTVENPYIMGMAPMTAAAMQIDAGNKGANAMSRAFDNGGAMGILAPGAGAKITEEARQELQKNVNQRLTGTENFKAIVAASAPMDWTEFGQSIVDLNIVEAGVNSTRKIANVYHLKSEVVLNDKAGSTYNNMKEGRKACITDGVFPVQTMIEDCLTQWLIPGWFNNDDSYYLAFDRSVYPECQPDMTEKVTWLDKATWLTPNQKLKEMDYPTNPDPMMDKVYMPANLKPIEDLGLDVTGIGFDTEIDDGQDENN